MDAAVSEAETPRNSSDIRNSMFSRSSPGAREEIDLCTPASVLPQQVESGRRSTISGSQSRQSIDSAEYLDIGKASIHSGASGIQCQSERNSCDRNTVDTSARARRLGSEPISDVPRRTNLVLNNKPVLEPRKCNKQDAKHRLFDVPLSDDLSSEEDLCRSDLRSAGKFKESNEAVGHVAKSRQLPTLDDDPTSSSDSNAELRQRSVKGRPRRMRKQRPAARANETLLNTSLVREINEEIDSLKRTFLAEPADLQPTAADTTLPAASASLDCEIPSIPPPPSTSETDTVSALLQSDKNDSLDAATADSVASVATQMQNDYDSDEEDDELMHKQYKRPEENRVDIPELRETKQVQDEMRKKKIREVLVRHPERPEALLEGVLFHARYLGSTQLISDTHTTKYTRMLQAQTALQQVKAPEGESQPSVEVELFVSSQKLLILNTNLKEILMDHALRTISFIADIGDIVVIMARRRLIATADGDTFGVNSCADGDGDNDGDGQQPGSPGSADEILPANRNGSGSAFSRSLSGDSCSTHSSASDATSSVRRAPLDVPKMQAKVVCHVIECEDAQLVAQSIGQAFQVAYLEFLKANGIEDPASGHDLDYQEVLNSQEMYNEELRLFTSAEHQKDVLVPKARAEPLGVVIVESGWGSVIPTVVLASMHPRGAAARCGQLNIGDQIISINGVSFVGLPLSTCQNYIKNVRTETSVKLRVISCPPVVEVLIRRPDPKYQLGFSVQNGVICSLLRGGIAERGGVRVGHRIIEIGGQSVVAVSHDKIVQKLSSAVGEIHMRTMPTTIFRLLTGQETPHYI